MNLMDVFFGPAMIGFLRKDILKFVFGNFKTDWEDQDEKCWGVGNMHENMGLDATSDGFQIWTHNYKSENWNRKMTKTHPQNT